LDIVRALVPLEVGIAAVGLPDGVPWVVSCRLVIKRGKVGAKGKRCIGLHEFEDMGFLLHFLRLDELLIDIDPNVGSCTVLDVDLCQVRAFDIGLFSSEGRLHFSDQVVAENRVLFAKHTQSLQAFGCK
jgi:hypothetical protein